MGNLDYEYLDFEINENIALLSINRPKALNAINVEVLSELGAAVETLAGEQDVRAMILTGAGDRSFVAGADIAQMSDYSEAEAKTFASQGHHVLAAIEALPFPVIAAVNGFALGGGCELALACDLILASENAKFGQPEVKLGLIPGMGGCIRLPRKIGHAAACEWIFSAQVYDAQQAKDVGLVREVLPLDKLLDRAKELAGMMAKQGPLAVAAAKKVIYSTAVLNTAQAGEVEVDAFAALFNTADTKEGTRAFVEKRHANFQGK